MHSNQGGCNVETANNGIKVVTVKSPYMFESPLSVTRG